MSEEHAADVWHPVQSCTRRHFWAIEPQSNWTRLNQDVVRNFDLAHRSEDPVIMQIVCGTSRGTQHQPQPSAAMTHAHMGESDNHATTCMLGSTA